MSTISAHDARRNIRIHGWINFLAGVTFLVPIIEAWYTTLGITIAGIVILSNISTLAVWLLEIPTSVFADTTGRRRSLILSVSANLIGAILIFCLPSWWGFVGAAIFGALYFSFWSGTGQAFLDENLKVLKQSDTFGRVIGRFMYFEQLAALGTPLVAAGLLKLFGDTGYRILAGLDVIAAITLVVLVTSLREVRIRRAAKNIAAAWRANIRTAKTALRRAWHEPHLRLLLIYRSLGNHVAFLPLILLPTLLADGMPSWGSGVVMTVAALATMIGSRYAYLIGERYGYASAWVGASILQGVLLIAAAWFTQSWIMLAIVFAIFNIGEGIWQPAWNHVLVRATTGRAVATIRSIIFSAFALYTTIGKQALAAFSVPTALAIAGIVLLAVNLTLGWRVIAASQSKSTIKQGSG